MIEDIYLTFITYSDVYILGLQNTLLASFFGLVFALIVGIIVASVRYYKIKYLARIFAVYVSIVRNTPLLVQIYFIYFGLPTLDITLTAFETGLLALTFNSGAYLSEIIRSSLNSIAKSQLEAAEALGLHRMRTLQKILLPQIAPFALPAIGGQFIQLIKDSSLLYTIAILELTKAAEQVGNETYEYIHAFTISCLLYIVICISLNLIVDYAEKKVSYSQ